MVSGENLGADENEFNCSVQEYLPLEKYLGIFKLFFYLVVISAALPVQDELYNRGCNVSGFVRVASEVVFLSLVAMEKVRV